MGVHVLLHEFGHTATTAIMSNMATMDVGRPVLVFDGDCGFCTWSVNVIRRWIRPRAQIVAWQLTDLDQLGLRMDECAEAVQFVEIDDSHTTGARAVAAMLRRSPQPWPLAGIVMDLPGVALVADRAYKLIARNRYKLPGATPACKIAVAA